MIANATEYQKAREEIRSLEQRLDRLQQDHLKARGLTKAGLRKLIARLHEELAVFEGTEETQFTDSR